MPSDKTLRDAARERCFHVGARTVSVGDAAFGMGASGAKGIMAGTGVRRLDEAGELDCVDNGSTATTKLWSVDAADVSRVRCDVGDCVVRDRDLNELKPDASRPMNGRPRIDRRFVALSLGAAGAGSTWCL